MAIEQGIWRIGDQPKKLKPAALTDEALLEDQVMKDISILNSDWMLIGRQVRTGYDKLIDLLAMDANGSIIIVELKRNKTPRDIKRKPSGARATSLKISGAISSLKSQTSVPSSPEYPQAPPQGPATSQDGM